MKHSKNKLVSLQKYANLQKIITVIAICIPLFLVLSTLLNGHLVFWYDNARDLQSAWDNLHKPTLIGPTSGIPGIFYGPYWIWLLSFGLLLSKDPVIVAFITATIPYFIIFPFIWFRFSKFMNFYAVIIGWLLFMLGSGFTYATQLWNPYPAPLITAGILYLLMTVNFKTVNKKILLQFLLLGFLLGLLINFHISFGIAFLFGSSLFLVWTISTLILRQKKTLKSALIRHGVQLVSIGAGFLIAFIPTLLFEVRHGFNQTQTLIHTFTQYGAVVQVPGMSKPLIAQEFGTTLATFLHIPTTIAVTILIIMLITFLWSVKTKKIKLQDPDKRIIMLLISVFTGIAFIYFTAKNPVWKYHFIGVDLLFVVLVTYLLSKLTFFRIGFVIVVIWAVVSTAPKIFIDYTSGTSYFIHQQNVIRTIAKDAGEKPYVAATYTNATYSHENTYLFRWLQNKDVPSDPNLTPDSDTVYLVIPAKEDFKVKDFINYRTPNTKYKTEKTWDTAINSKIIKRVKR